MTEPKPLEPKMKRNSLASLLSEKGYFPPPPAGGTLEYSQEVELQTEQSFSRAEFLENEAIELEEEMPGNSIQVLPNETESLPMFYHSNEGDNESSKNDLIELYGTIAFLKQENAELNKEFNHMKVYYIQQLESQQEKQESELKQMHFELHEAKQELNEKHQTILQLDNQNKELSMELQSLIENKNILEDRLTIMNDNTSIKHELMRLQEEYHHHQQEKQAMIQDYQTLQKEYQQSTQNESKIKQELQNEINQMTNQVQ